MMQKDLKCWFETKLEVDRFRCFFRVLEAASAKKIKNMNKYHEQEHTRLDFGRWKFATVPRCVSSAAIFCPEQT